MEEGDRKERRRKGEGKEGVRQGRENKEDISMLVQTAVLR